MSASSSFYNTISDWMTDLFNTIISIFKIALLSKRPSKFHGIKAQDSTYSCSVLGSGPSLANSLNQIGRKSKTHYMAVNTFVFSDTFESIQPEYYLILDPGMWLANNEITKKTKATLIAKTTWKMVLFIPFTARNSSFISDLSKHDKIKIHFLNYVVFKGFKSLSHVFYRRNLAMPQAQNVLVAALCTAINIGYKSIRLYGADHDWHRTLYVNQMNVLCIKQVHFYEHEQEIKHVPFYKGMHDHETFRMDEIFAAWAKVFQGYHNIAAYARKRGVKILNATPNSFVDAFERE